MPTRFRISGVTRWLLMVVGCAVLETAQPMMAQVSEPLPADRVEDTVIFPGGEGADSTGRESTEMPSLSGSWIFALGVGGLAGGFWWWQRRRMQMPSRTRELGLAVEQTKSLGNRQYLIVASCDGRRFLLGVAPGQINLLTALNDQADDDAVMFPEIEP
jgi:flagellar protein FliO/FliZ